MDRESAVINGYKLRNSENYSNVYVSRDLIMEDRIRSRENYLKKRQARATTGNTQPTEIQSAQQATLLAAALVSLQAPVAAQTTTLPITVAASPTPETAPVVAENRPVTTEGDQSHPQEEGESRGT